MMLLLPYHQEKQLLAGFYRAAMFLKNQVDKHKWTWSSNFLREYVRCETGLKFSNSISPEILRKLRDQHPELRRYIEVNKRKNSRN